MKVVIDHMKCTNCGTCFDYCTHDAIYLAGHATLDPAACKNCGICIQMCPSNAIRRVK